jgi:hypothetical protein
LRVPFDECAADEGEQLGSLMLRKRRERCFEHLIDDYITLSKRGFSFLGEPVPDCASWSCDALDHPSPNKTAGEGAEGLVGLERHLGEGMSR